MSYTHFGYTGNLLFIIRMAAEVLVVIQHHLENKFIK